MMTKSQTITNQIKKSFASPVGAFVWALIIVLGLFILNVILIFSDKTGVAQLFIGWFETGKVYLDNFSSIGSAFGALGTLFSGLAFAAFFFALQAQRSDIAEQSKQFKKQRVETLFFNLLSLHRNNLDSITYKNDSKESSGREVFRFIYNDFKEKKQRYFSSSPHELGLKEHEERIETYYEYVYEEYDHVIGFYFRHIYHILRVIREEVGDKAEDKKMYAGIVRAQLSRYELLLLFYNCLSSQGKNLGGQKEFKDLVEEFSIFKGFPESDLLNPKRHPKLYRESAYKEM
jgi:hypothetical protein